MSRAHQVWSVPLRLDDVPETGRRFDLWADEPARAAIARVAGLPGIERLKAGFDVARYGSDGLRVAGDVSATVRQTCVVTLEPMTNEISESVDLLFAAQARRSGLDGDFDAARHDPPEPLVNGTVDLAAIAVEFLMLGIDPYPRKPDAAFQATADEDGGARPFAALATLKKSPGRTGG